MKRKLLILICIIVTAPVFAQQFAWVHSRNVQYALNPAMPRHQLHVSTAGLVFEGGLDSLTLIYGSDIYGTVTLNCYDSQGALQWNVHFDTKVMIGPMTSDASGNVIVSGNYMETMHIGQTDSMLNTGVGFDVNTFLICFNSSGGIVWKRNLTVSHTEIARVDAIGFDRSNNVWYGYGDFFNTNINRLNNSGADVQTITVVGGKTLGGFCFDPSGNMFITGSVEMGNIQIADLTINAPDTYNMYVARLEAGATHTTWIKVAHDATFQSPCIVPDPWGNAYLSGNLMDTTVWGNISFRHPQWVYDIFLTKVDAAGDFHWGIQVPQTPTISGDFECGMNSFLDVDQDGNAYITGATRNHVDWGNGVVSGSTAGIYSQLSYISFDSSGTARWVLNGGTGSMGYNQALNLDVSDQGDIYFTAGVTGAAVFGNLTTNNSGNYASIVGKIDPNSPNGIFSPAIENSMMLYPNPASSRIYLSHTFADADLEIFDFTGKCIFAYRGTVNSVDVSHFVPGVYFIRVKDEHGVSSQRFVISRN